MPIHENVMKTHLIRALTSKDRAFINDQLIPFYNKMIDRYTPDAIVFVRVGICHQLKELETSETGTIKGVKACLMCTDKGIVLQSMMAGSRSLVIPSRSLGSIEFKPDQINGRDNPDIYDRYNLSFEITIHFTTIYGIEEMLIVHTADYCDWRDQEYAELLSPKPFLRELRSIQKRMRINDK